MRSFLRLLASLLGLAIHLPANAAFGHGDPSFLPSSGGCQAIAVLEDGSAYIDTFDAPAVTRITSNGAPDVSWGDGGRIVYPMDPLYSRFSTVAQLLVAKDGGLFLVDRDYISGYGGVVHILPNGRLDVAFGAGGRARTSFILSASLQPDGKVVLLTTQSVVLDTQSSSQSFERLTAQGQLDPSFRQFGVVYASIGLTSRIYGWALRSDGDVEIGSYQTPYYSLPPTDYQRVAPSLIIGHADGSVTVAAGGRLVPQGIATWMSPIAKVEPTGALVIALDTFEIARFLPDGSYDTSIVSTFSASGETNFISVANSLWREPDGSWTLAGLWWMGVGFGPPIVDSDLRAIRFNAQGVYDSSFGEKRFGYIDGSIVFPSPIPGGGAPVARASDGSLLFSGNPAGTLNGCTLGRYSTDSPRQETTVVEYYAAELDHYFMTSTPGEIAELDGDSSLGWMRTGESFGAWAPGNLPGVAHVYRFYGDPIIGPNSHFYTAEAFEYEGLIALAAATPPGMPAWRLEAKPFDMAIPTDGVCPSNLQPVYRVFNGIVGTVNGPNHRYTTDPTVYAAMQAKGWIAEGVHFCAPPRLN
jgi:hypothetical protein